MFRRTPGRMRKLLRKVRGIGPPWLRGVRPHPSTPSRRAHDRGAFNTPHLDARSGVDVPHRHYRHRRVRCGEAAPGRPGLGRNGPDRSCRAGNRFRERAEVRADRAGGRVSADRFLPTAPTTPSSITVTRLIRDQRPEAARLRLGRPERGCGSGGGVSGRRIPAAVPSKTRFGVPPWVSTSSRVPRRAWFRRRRSSRRTRRRGPSCRLRGAWPRSRTACASPAAYSSPLPGGRCRPDRRVRHPAFPGSGQRARA